MCIRYFQDPEGPPEPSTCNSGKYDMQTKGKHRYLAAGLPPAAFVLLLPPCASAASNGGQQAGGASLILVLIAAFLLLFMSIILIMSLVVKQARPLFKLAGSIFRSIAQALTVNPDVRNLVDRHPRLFGFLARRFDRTRFSGLTLTILGLFFFYTLVQFLGVVQSLLASDPIVAADLRLANLLSTYRTPGMTRLFLFVTILGKWQVVLTFAAAVSGILLLWRKWTYIPGLWLCVAGASTSTWLGKIAFHRQRPAVAEYVEWSYSFPSGHSVISVALFGFFLYLAWRLWQGRGSRLLALFAGTAVILAVGTSRLYLGVHYLSDVWGGYLLGLMWLLAGVSLSEAAAMKFPAQVPPPSGPRALKAASWFLCLIALCIYTLYGTTYNPPREIRAPDSLKVISYDISSIFSDNSLSRYTETITGKSQEPISFVIAASGDEALIGAFESSGWKLASPENVGDLVRAGKAAVLDRADPTAPMTPSFWEGHPHDFGFQKPLEHSTVRERHHARFWRTDLSSPDGLRLYVGTASLDVGLKWGVTHKIQANIDAEREYLFADLSASGLVENYSKVNFVQPNYGSNFSGDPFFTDGKIYLITLMPVRKPHTGSSNGLRELVAQPGIDQDRAIAFASPFQNGF